MGGELFLGESFKLKVKDALQFLVSSTLLLLLYWVNVGEIGHIPVLTLQSINLPQCAVAVAVSQQVSFSSTLIGGRDRDRTKQDERVKL